jgi:hypothetical protein
MAGASGHQHGELPREVKAVPRLQRATRDRADVRMPLDASRPGPVLWLQRNTGNVATGTMIASVQRADDEKSEKDDGKPEETPALRLQYHAEVVALAAKRDEMVTAGATPEEIARALHKARRDLGVKYKNVTPEPLRSQIYQRNLDKYGDQLGPTIDYLRQSGKSWEQIIESALRTGGGDLGLQVRSKL